MPSVRFRIPDLIYGKLLADSVLYGFATPLAYLQYLMSDRAALARVAPQTITPPQQEQPPPVGPDCQSIFDAEEAVRKAELQALLDALDEDEDGNLKPQTLAPVPPQPAQTKAQRLETAKQVREDFRRMYSEVPMAARPEDWYDKREVLVQEMMRLLDKDDPAIWKWVEPIPIPVGGE